MQASVKRILQVALAALAAGLLAACGGGGDDGPSAPANSAPVARAGANATGMVATSVAVDGSGSSDADGDAITYAWTIAAAPAGSTATLTGGTTARPSIAPDREGAYTLSLVVSDGKASSTAATVTVTATPLVAEVILDKAEPLADKVKLSLTPGIVLPVSWYVDATLLGDGAAADANSLQWDTVGVINGPHRLTARVKTGAASFLEVKRTVVVGNSTILIKPATPTVTPGNIQVLATVTSDYGITQVTVAFDGVEQGSLASANSGDSGFLFNIDTTHVAAGKREIAITATDTSGSTKRITVPVEITVDPRIGSPGG